MSYSILIILATCLSILTVESRPQVQLTIVPDPESSELTTSPPNSEAEDNKELFIFDFDTFVSKLTHILESMDMDNEIDDNIYISVHPHFEGESRRTFTTSKPHKTHSRLMRHHVDTKPQNPAAEQQELTTSPVAKGILESKSSPPDFTMA